ncbi:hypothetical protein BDN70DRAFT_165344 [Pholiota conissans]|uniref:Uncharacterized protein n=1 Tax=Pholiota conissans TaxID=109636 RepID=A0A9P5YW57_9AGAR|nr:hypothetical protein BDN70DRAFT_165344 [Pholiota conissans]
MLSSLFSSLSNSFCAPSRSPIGTSGTASWFIMGSISCLFSVFGNASRAVLRFLRPRLDLAAPK